jgi:hypothetical protein
LAFSYWTIKPWFLTKGKLLLCSSYLPLGVPNWSVIYISTGAINIQDFFHILYALVLLDIMYFLVALIILHFLKLSITIILKLNQRREILKKTESTEQLLEIQARTRVLKNIEPAA